MGKRNTYDRKPQKMSPSTVYRVQGVLPKQPKFSLRAHYVSQDERTMTFDIQDGPLNRRGHLTAPKENLRIEGKRVVYLSEGGTA